MSEFTQTIGTARAQLPALLPRRDVAPAAMGEEHWITLADLLRTVKVHWRNIVLAGCITGALATVGVFLVTPKYQGAALVMVDEQQSHVVDGVNDPAVLSELPSDPSSIASQVEVLQSRALAGEVVDNLKLVNDEEFNGERNDLINMATRWVRSLDIFGLTADKAGGLSPEQKKREKVVDTFLRRLDVNSLGHSTIIEVDFLSESATKAARIANAIADIYVRNQMATKSKAGEGASHWLTDRVAQLSRQASAATGAVQQYKAEHGLVDTSTGTALTDQEMGNLMTQLIAAEGNQAQAQAKLTQMRQLVASGRDADVSQVVDSPLITQLREQETTLLQQDSDMQSRYGPLNPKLQDIEGQLKVLRAKISDEVNRVVGTVSNDATVAAAQAAALKRDMANLKVDTNGQNLDRVKLGELEADATSATAVYQAFLERLKQAQQQATLKTPDAHVASPAAVPLKTHTPKTLIIIGASIPLGLMIGFLIALAKDRLCAGFRSASELEESLGLPVLATLPEIKSRKHKLKDAGLQVVRKPNSHFSESVRGLESSLELDGDGNTAGKAILVTSSLPGEGKTLTAVSLARQAALSGHRVVIVDADLRRPRVAAALGLPKQKYGLKDYLDNRCALDEVLAPDAHSPVVALTATRTDNPAYWVRSQKMAALIGRLRNIADLVVIDSPPLLAVHDAQKLAPLTDGALFVVHWEKTPREATNQAAKALRSSGVPILGTILTRAHPVHYRYYVYGYTGAPSLATYYEN
jgi:polysaccharide biosynthesis transport protein